MKKITTPTCLGHSMSKLIFSLLLSLFSFQLIHAANIYMGDPNASCVVQRVDEKLLSLKNPSEALIALGEGVSSFISSYLVDGAALDLNGGQIMLSCLV